MNWLHTILILAVAFVAVFLEAWFDGFRNCVGAQIDFLPALMVYAGLTNGLSPSPWRPSAAGCGLIRFRPIRWG